MRLSYKSTFHHRNPQYNKIDFLHLSKTRQWALLLILKSIKLTFIIYHILRAKIDTLSGSFSICLSLSLAQKRTKFNWLEGLEGLHHKN